MLFILGVYGSHGTRVEVRGPLWELVLSFHHLGSRARTQVIRLGCKRLSLLSHLSGTRHEFLIT